MKKSWIDKKTVIITGASSGMGRALSILLVKNHGCKVIGVGRNEEKLTALKQILGENFDFFRFDVGDLTGWENFVHVLQTSGITPDVLVNNAGMLPPFQRFERLDTEVFHQTLQTNFFSVVYACNALLPLLKNSPTPAVINISSSAALCALPGVTPYAASKAAVKNFTESLSAEYEKKKLYVGLIFPGFTLTDLFRAQAKEKEENKLFSLIATPCDKMAKKIERALVKKKRRKVFGLDAKGMNLLYKLFPTHAAGICGKILKLFKLTMFDDVFTP